MDEETAKRVERKIDYVAGLLITAWGCAIGVAIIIYSPLSDWIKAVGFTFVTLIFPAYLISKYRDIS